MAATTTPEPANIGFFGVSTGLTRWTLRFLLLIDSVRLPFVPTAPFHVYRDGMSFAHDHLRRRDGGAGSFRSGKS
jgi:hypothetical protein